MIPIFAHIQRLSQPWFIMPDAHDALTTAIRDLSGKAFWSMEAPKQKALPYTVEDGVAKIDIHGPMARTADDFDKYFFGIASMAEIADALEGAASDPGVTAVFLDIDSPGGTVAGTAELAGVVRDVSKRKAVLSYASGRMCSAAYYVGSQANAVIASQSADVGNVGTVISFLDVSKAYEAAGLERVVIKNEDSPLKGMGSTGAPLTEEQRKFLQANVNESAAEFKEAVRGARAVKSAGLDGGWYHGARAQSLGLIDGISDSRRAMKMAREHATWRKS